MLGDSVYYSFIIPTLASRTNIFKIINSIENSGMQNYEIIIPYYNKYNYSNKDIILKLKSISNNKIRIVNSKIGSSGENRNLGSQIARGIFLCFVDDDVTLDNSLFLYLKNNRLQEKCIYFPEIKNEIYVPYPLGDHVSGKAYVSACFVISKKAFIEIGFMNEKLNAYRDDSEFFIRATKIGIKLLFMETAYVYHPIRFLKWKTFINIFRKQEYEPLFHKLISGNYNGVIQSRLVSTTPNKYGFSVVFYYALAISIFISLFLLFNFIYILIFLVLIYILLSLFFTSLFIHFNKKFLGKKLLKSLPVLSIIAILLPIYLGGRIIGSIKYKHFTI